MTAGADQRGASQQKEKSGGKSYGFPPFARDCGGTISQRGPQRRPRRPVFHRWFNLPSSGDFGKR